MVLLYDTLPRFLRQFQSNLLCVQRKSVYTSLMNGGETQKPGLWPIRPWWPDISRLPKTAYLGLILLCSALWVIGFLKLGFISVFLFIGVLSEVTWAKDRRRKHEVIYLVVFAALLVSDILSAVAFMGGTQKEFFPLGVLFVVSVYATRVLALETHRRF